MLWYEVMGLRLGELYASLFQISIYHYCILNMCIYCPYQRHYSQQMAMIQKSQLDTKHTLADFEEPRPSRYICFTAPASAKPEHNRWGGIIVRTKIKGCLPWSVSSRNEWVQKTTKMAISMSTMWKGNIFYHPTTRQRLTGNYLELLAFSRNQTLLEMSPTICCPM